MQRILASLVLLAALGVAHAQTIKITTSNGACTYPTGTVTSDPATPGQLLATATSAPTGTGCPSTTTGTSSPPTFGPTQQLAPLTTTLSNSGGNVAFSFQAAYANTACTGAITGAAGGAFASGNTLCSASGCGGLVNASASFPANASSTTDNVYNVKVTCTGSGGSTDSSVATVTVSHSNQVTSTCPIITSANQVVANFSRWSGPQKIYTDSSYGGASKTVDVGSFDQVFGTWPGSVLGNILYFKLPLSNYLSMSFTVPNNYMTAANAPNPLYGGYKIGETGNSTSDSLTISTTCGDFSNPATYPSSTVVPGCWKNKALTGSLALVWNASGSSCVLQNNQTYYLNIINADISQVQPNGGGQATSTKSTQNATYPCTTSTCDVPIYDGPGTWGGYTPQ